MDAKNRTTLCEKHGSILEHQIEGAGCRRVKLAMTSLSGIRGWRIATERE